MTTSRTPRPARPASPSSSAAAAAALAALLASGPSSPAGAALIEVAGAIASSEFTNDGRLAVNAVNGAGLFDVGHSPEPANNMWLSAQNDTAGVFIVDLGAVYELDSMRVWNYNEVNAAFPAEMFLNRGVATANIDTGQALDDLATHLADVSLMMAPTDGDAVDFAEAVDLEGVQARFVQIDVLSNHGDGGFTGLSEVQFDGTLIPGTEAPRPLAVVDVQASTEFGGREAFFAADGSGTFASSFHTIVPTGNMWLTTQNDPAPTITFDLGAVQAIGHMQVLNYNENLPGRPDLLLRGVAQADILVSDDGVEFTPLVEDAAFEQAPGENLTPFGQRFDLNVSARAVRIEVDSNFGDSFTGLSEVQFFTPDTDDDEDGLPDVYEQDKVGNLDDLNGAAEGPGPGPGTGDFDGDGLSDLAEFRAGTDPTEEDTDGDGLTDGDEVAGAGLRPPTSPLRVDSDGDGIPDNIETNDGTFEGTETDTGTNPAARDTDGDRYDDGDEIARGTDPLNGGSFPLPQLVALWQFEGAGGLQPDDSGNGHDAVAEGGVDFPFDDERQSAVAEFDGNDAYLEVDHDDQLALTGDLSIAAWVNVTNVTDDPDGAPFRGILGKTAGDMGNIPAPYDLYLLSMTGEPRFLIGDGSAVAATTAMTAPPPGEWHHLAVSRIGPTVTHYYDGQVDGEYTVGTPTAGDAGGQLFIGNRPDLVTDMLGRLDDVAIFEGGLAPALVGRLMDGDFSDFGLADPGAFRVIEVARDLDTGVVSMTWNSRPGRAYTIEVTFDLADPEGWVQLSDNWPSQGPETTFEDTFVAPGAGSQIFYRIGLRVPPATLREGFEGDADGWVSQTIDGFVDTATHWEFGPPVGGPGAAFSGEAVAGTDLDADYDHLTGISLRSPVVDLTGRGSVRLRFWHYLDADDDEGGRLNVLEADGTEIARPLEVFPGGPEGNTTEWTRRTVSLPDVDRPVILEWEFLAGPEGENGAGWFIDDVFIE